MIKIREGAYSSKSVFELRTLTAEVMYFPFQYALTPSKFVLLIALALKMTIYPKICQNHCLRMQKAHFRLTCVAQERLFLISSLMFLVSDRLLSLCRRDIAGCTSGYIGKILETVPLTMSERYWRLYHWLCRRDIADCTTEFASDTSPKWIHQEGCTWNRQLHTVGFCATLS